jgi:hypothetical protein
MAKLPRISETDFARINAELVEYEKAFCARVDAFEAEKARIMAAEGCSYTEDVMQRARKVSEAAVPLPVYPLSYESPNAALVPLYYREEQRLKSNATRAANAEKRAAKAIPAGTYAVGEAVEVHSFGHWYKGTVTKLGRTGKVTVQYTSGTGVTREKAVNINGIRKA